MKIRASQEMYVDGQTRYKDSEFDLADEYARVLVMTGRAQEVAQKPKPEPQPPMPPAPPPQPQPPAHPMTTESAAPIAEPKIASGSGTSAGGDPKRKRYMRRDMRAEN